MAALRNAPGQLNTWEAEVEAFKVQGQPGQHVTPCLKGSGQGMFPACVSLQWQLPPDKPW